MAKESPGNIIKFSGGLRESGNNITSDLAVTDFTSGLLYLIKGVTVQFDDDRLTVKSKDMTDKIEFTSARRSVGNFADVMAHRHFGTIPTGGSKVIVYSGKLSLSLSDASVEDVYFP